MPLKLNAAAEKSSLPVKRFWSTIMAIIRARRQRARDRRILSHMNDHNLRDIGRNRSGPFNRTR